MSQTTYENVGRLWEKTSKGGVPYLSGTIEIDGKPVQVTIWRNQYKKSTADVKTPDFIVQALVIEPEEKTPEPF
jgi:hypothetical protein